MAKEFRAMHHTRTVTADVFQRTAEIRRESGFAGLVGRACHRLAAPVVRWGGVTFFERRLEGPAGEHAPIPVGTYVRQMLPDEIEALLEGGDPDQEAQALAERFRRGDRAFGAIDVAGRLCHLRWVSTTRVHIPEIKRDIVLGARQAYFYNGYTRPDARKRGIDGLVRHRIFEILREEGFISVYSYVRTENRAGIRAALRWQRPAGTLRYIALRRCKPVVLGDPAATLPMLEQPHMDSEINTRDEAWRRWFTSWIGEPLEKRSTGCAALNDAAFQSAAAFIRESLAISASDDVLDVGCDSAMITRHVAPHARRLLGIDFIHEMLRDSTRLSLRHGEGGALWYVTADACRLPVRSGAFSKVYCSAMLHTLPTREYGRQAIDELVRVTAPGGGVLVSSVPDRAKKLASRIGVWKRAHPIEKITLPVRWLVPRRLKMVARRLLRRPATGLPEFLDYNLRAIARSFEMRGYRCEVRDFPRDYWSDEFRRSRANLLIRIPHRRSVSQKERS